MVTRAKLAVLIGTLLVGSAGFVAATGGLNRSIWGGDNPGLGGEHAAMPPAGQENNHGGNDDQGDGDENEAGEDEDENETGEGENESETGEDEDENETGEHEDENETGEHEDENETGEHEDENESFDAAEARTMYTMALRYPTERNSTGDGNWSRNWSRGNVTCTGSGNRTSGSIGCSWPAGTFTRGNLNCSWEAGSFDVSWSPGTFSKSWTGGNFTCSWTGGSWSRSDESTDSASSGSGSEGTATRG